MFKNIRFSLILPMIAAFIMTTVTTIYAEPGIIIRPGYSVNVNDADVDLGEAAILNSGHLEISTGEITLGRNWQNAGSFSAGLGVVSINSLVSAQTITTGGVSSAFNILNINNPFGAAFFDALHCKKLNVLPGVEQLFFSTTGVHTITSSFRSNGSSGNRIKMSSFTPGTAWNLNTPSTTVNFVDVSDSHQTDGKLITAFNSIDGSNNRNWTFSDGEFPDCPHDGDVDLDGVITINDVILAFDAIVDSSILDDCQSEHADIDNDGAITVNDVTCIFASITGIPCQDD